MVDHRIVLGYVPVRRDMFPAAVAAATEKQIRSRVEEILSHQHDIQLLTIDDITDGGMLPRQRRRAHTFPSPTLKTAGLMRRSWKTASTVFSVSHLS